MADLCDDTAIRSFVAPGSLVDTTYYIYDAATVLTWTDVTEVSSSQLDSLCGVWSYELTQTDSSPLDSSVFTIDYTAKTLTILSNDQAKESSYTVQVKATQGIYAAYAITKTFVVSVEDLCDETATRAFVDPGTLIDTIYNVYETATVLSWTDTAEVTSTQPTSRCGAWSYSLTQSNSAPLDTDVFTVDSVAKSLTIQTNDLSKETTYTILVTAWQGIYTA